VQLVNINQTIQYSVNFGDQNDKISEVLTHCYSLLNAYTLMLEAIHSLWFCNYQMSPASRLLFSRKCKQISNKLASMELNRNYKIIAPFKANANLMAMKPIKPYMTMPSIVMALLNLKLSFDLLTQQLNALIIQGQE